MTSPDEKGVTEREAVLRERAAFMNGVLHMYRVGHPALFYDTRDKEAVKRYPLPPIVRPRVETVFDPKADCLVEVRFYGGVLEYRHVSKSSRGFRPFDRDGAEINLARAILSVVENPTETVPDEGGEV
jgi:hypothetical protein